MHFTKLYFMLLTAIPIFSFAANQLLHYDPAVVELAGTIETITYPGPPNYEDIKNGDTPETGRYLKLDHPIDVDLMPNANDELNEPEKNISVVQLVIDDFTPWKKIKNGRHVQVTGKLFHALTGHHHVTVLMMVEKVNK